MRGGTASVHKGVREENRKTPTSPADIDAIAERAANLPKDERRKLTRALGALGQAPGPRGARLGALLTPILARLVEAEKREDAEARHIAKLDAAGQLQASYLIKTLKAGELGLFAAALARLGNYIRRDVREALNSPDRPELLALALAGVGLDRGTFPSVLALVRGLTGGRPGGGARGERRALAAFGPFGPEVTASAFRRASEALASA